MTAMRQTKRRKRKGAAMPETFTLADWYRQKFNVNPPSERPAWRHDQQH
ncbi:hypothetical protein [Mycobacterium marinum]|uniref:Uncharacterized protein n=1 Tax=Mycobacterium marinum TaxID=1781 RepID=A0A3E2N2P6_MYCMR|nr:hypothetical protein [Mycobacterium marinum]RFZ47669.1 hypothetical protein DAVIS_00384 [Mycobacterium marinum]